MADFAPYSHKRLHFSSHVSKPDVVQPLAQDMEKLKQIFPYLEDKVSFGALIFVVINRDFKRVL